MLAEDAIKSAIKDITKMIFIKPKLNLNLNI
jgi:hypothetical protein